LCLWRKTANNFSPFYLNISRRGGFIPFYTRQKVCPNQTNPLPWNCIWQAYGTLMVIHTHAALGWDGLRWSLLFQSYDTWAICHKITTSHQRWTGSCFSLLDGVIILVIRNTREWSGSATELQLHVAARSALIDCYTCLSRQVSWGEALVDFNSSVIPSHKAPAACRPHSISAACLGQLCKHARTHARTLGGPSCVLLASSRQRR